MADGNIYMAVSHDCSDPVIIQKEGILVVMKFVKQKCINNNPSINNEKVELCCQIGRAHV